MNIEIADQDLVKQYQEEVNQILDIVGHPEALVTDESWLSDFPIDDEMIRQLGELVKGKIEPNECLVDIARRMREAKRVH